VPKSMVRFLLLDVGLWSLQTTTFSSEKVAVYFCLQYTAVTGWALTSWNSALYPSEPQRRNNIEYWLGWYIPKTWYRHVAVLL